MALPILTLDELTTPLTRAEIESSVYAVLAKVGLNVTSWRRGSPTRTLIVGVASVTAALSSHIAAIARGGFVELADGSWLDLVAYYVYGVQRTAAQYATGIVQLSNTGGGIYQLDAGDLVVTNPTTKASYRSTAAFTLASGTPSSPIVVLVPVIAVEAGSDSTSDAGAITELTTVLPSVDCANPERIYGSNAETDEQLRSRCTERLGALSPMGPWDAYSYAARSATRETDGANVGVTRVRLTKDGYGHVTLYVAKQSGAIPPADLLRVADAVERRAVPQAITAYVQSATTHPIAPSYTAYVYNTSGRTEQQVLDAIKSKLDAFADAQPIGGHVIGSDSGKVFADSMRSAIASALPEVFRVVLTTPSSDVVLAENEVLTLGVPLGAVQFVAPTEGYAG